MEYILISACLLGHAVRYDGRSVPNGDRVLDRWVEEERVIPVCPEVAGGLPIPRSPAEIEPGANASAVLTRQARIMAVSGEDVTDAFVQGAHSALAVARQHNIRMAVLKEGSPSCGSGYVYDGHFTGHRQPGMGVTAQLLNQAGIRVFSEKQWAEAQTWLAKLETAR